jgi:hypothetical protein
MHRICPEHRRSLSIEVEGGTCWRFCLQCARLHTTEQFSGDRRSCQESLLLRRQRKRERQLAEREDREECQRLSKRASAKRTAAAPAADLVQTPSPPCRRTESSHSAMPAPQASSNKEAGPSLMLSPSSGSFSIQPKLPLQEGSTGSLQSALSAATCLLPGAAPDSLTPAKGQGPQQQRQSHAPAPQASPVILWVQLQPPAPRQPQAAAQQYTTPPGLSVAQYQQQPQLLPVTAAALPRGVLPLGTPPMSASAGREASSRLFVGPPAEMRAAPAPPQRATEPSLTEEALSWLEAFQVGPWAAAEPPVS